MGTSGDLELEAAFRLQELAKHQRLLDRARGASPVGRLPLATLLAGLGVAIALLLTQKQPPLVMVGAVTLVGLISAAVKEVNDRIDALLTLLERAKVVGPDLTP